MARSLARVVRILPALACVAISVGIANPVQATEDKTMLPRTLTATELGPGFAGPGSPLDVTAQFKDVCGIPTATITKSKGTMRLYTDLDFRFVGTGAYKTTKVDATKLISSIRTAASAGCAESEISAGMAGGMMVQKTTLVQSAKVCDDSVTLRIEGADKGTLLTVADVVVFRCGNNLGFVVSGQFGGTPPKPASVEKFMPRAVTRLKTGK